MSITNIKSLAKIGKDKTEKEKVDLRRAYVEEKTGVTFDSTGHFSINPACVAGKNCENMIGATQIPLGIAGPLILNKLKTYKHPTQGSSTQGSSTREPPTQEPLNQKTMREYFIPLATTEGALVASVSRGCKATRLSGGITTKVEHVGISRAPVFSVKNLAQAEKLITWINKKFAQIKEIADATSAHIQLLSITPFLSGKYVFLRCVYNTHEAMGMNMATIATQQIVHLIKEKLNINCISLSGNMCVDKKPCWLNFIAGRGNKVWAETIIKKDIVQNTLKTTSEKIVEVVQSKNMLGSQMSGSLGFNAHYANIIAALFIATGQDPAHIVEGSMGVTTAQVEADGNLYFSVYLPAVIIGTVGGGTGLNTQKEALNLLGLSNGKTGEALELAHIVSGAVLAGELSLIAALAENHLVQAHETLGRNKKNIGKLK